MKLKDILKKQGEIYKNLINNKTIKEYDEKVKETKLSESIPEKYKKKLKALKEYLEPEFTELINQGEAWAEDLEEAMKGIEQVLNPSIAYKFLKEMVGDLDEDDDEVAKELKKLMKGSSNDLGYNLIKKLFIKIGETELELEDWSSEEELLRAVYKKLKNLLEDGDGTPTEKNLLKKLKTQNDKVDPYLQLSLIIQVALH